MSLRLVSRGTSTSPLVDAYGQMPDTACTDTLWGWLEDTLREAYGIEGIFYITYPVGDAAGTLAEMMDRAVWKSSYPQDYVNRLSGNIMHEHRSALMVLETGRMCRWDNPALREGATEGEMRRFELDVEYGMDVGVCLPLHTSGGRICGGFGLRSYHLDADIFYAAAEEDETQLTSMLTRFDERFRGPYATETFHITRQERRVLAHIAGGLSVLRAAHELGLSPKTVEFYLRSVRMKTRSATTAEAVAKAVFFNML